MRVTHEVFQRSHGDLHRHPEPLPTWDREAPGLLFATAKVRADLPYRMIAFTCSEPRDWLGLLTDAHGPSRKPLRGESA